ncbi:hypothetical protein SAMN04488524_2582 [Pedobacter africanus]|uniref:Uncharacterized protein n=2 Tax=Pedobacter africanus TaxID=151894 RepID=A0A1W2BSH8_9SPHI|nr:hypothetical protein SAMN04488524_2582 [Pedobacter africanus]
MPFVSLFLALALLMVNQKIIASGTNLTDVYTNQVVFPAGFQVGDYIEFLGVSPADAGASGNYEISISYTRGSVAAAATYLASISHASPDIWREVGRVNSNGYHGMGSTGHNFTIDCNTQYGYARFRLRAINTIGVLTDPIYVNVKVRSINLNGGWASLNVTGNDLTVTKLLPMTNDWSLYVGNTSNTNSAHIAIKALENGNVGIGTLIPNSKLAVNGNIRAHEVKVETANWPDYVFARDYQLPTLQETEKHIKDKGHLPGIPSAAEVKANGVDLGEMNAKLLQKIEELTLHLIGQNKTIELQQKMNSTLNEKVRTQEIRLSNLEDKLGLIHKNQKSN